MVSLELRRRLSPSRRLLIEWSHVRVLLGEPHFPANQLSTLSIARASKNDVQHIFPLSERHHTRVSLGVRKRLQTAQKLA
jgi:hypothetical protein